MRLKAGRASVRAIARLPKGDRPKPKWMVLSIVASVVTASVVLPPPVPVEEPGQPAGSTNVSILEPQNGTALETDSVGLRASIGSNTTDEKQIVLTAREQRITSPFEVGELSRDLNSLAPGLNIVQVSVGDVFDLAGVIAPRSSYHFEEPTEGGIHDAAQGWTVTTDHTAPVKLSHLAEDDVGGSLLARKKTRKLGVVFAVDVTFSMSNHLDEVRSFSKGFIDDLNGSGEWDSVQMAFIEFKDSVISEAPVWQPSDAEFPFFTGQGGGGIEEGQYAAIEGAIDFLSSSPVDRQSIIVLVSDAPPLIAELETRVIDRIYKTLQDGNVKVIPIVIHSDPEANAKDLNFDAARSFGKQLATKTAGQMVELETSTWEVFRHQYRTKKAYEEAIKSRNLDRKKYSDRGTDQAKSLIRKLVRDNEHWDWRFPNDEIQEIRNSYGEYLHFSLTEVEEAELILRSPSQTRMAICRSTATKKPWHQFSIRLDESFGAHENETDQSNFKTFLRSVTSLSIRCNVRKQTKSIGLDRVILTMASRFDLQSNEKKESQ